METTGHEPGRRRDRSEEPQEQENTMDYYDYPRDHMSREAAPAEEPALDDDDYGLEEADPSEHDVETDETE
jgi:hypothetical protein